MVGCESKQLESILGDAWDLGESQWAVPFVWASLWSLLQTVIVGGTGAALQGGDHAHSQPQLSPAPYDGAAVLEIEPQQREG